MHGRWQPDRSLRLAQGKLPVAVCSPAYRDSEKSPSVGGPSAYNMRSLEETSEIMIQPESVEHADYTYAPAGSTDDNPGDVLTRRLAQLQDPVWVKHVLELALGQLTPAPVSVDDYLSSTVRSSLAATLMSPCRLALRCRTGGATFLRRVSCTSFLQSRRGTAG